MAQQSDSVGASAVVPPEPTAAPAAEAKATETVTLSIATPFTDAFRAKVGDETYEIVAGGTEVPAAAADELVKLAKSCGVKLNRKG